MVFEKKSLRVLLAVFAGAAVFVSLSSAAIPSNYKGVPYPLGSSPKEIPGRINFHDYDKGGPGVSFVETDMASGHWGNCFAGLRDTGIYADGDPDHPSFTMTNHFSSPSDTFYAAGVTYPHGVRYPSPDTSFAANDWYIGACHGDNWFNVTIHVPISGKYWISSVWAASNTYINYQIFFIGTQYAATKDTIKTDTVKFTDCTDYHAWRKYADFASIQLDSGVQIMKFYDESWHLNQDFLYFATDSGKFTFPNNTSANISIKANDSKQPIFSVDKQIVTLNLTDVGITKIALYNCLGREVVTLLNKQLTAGTHQISLPKNGLQQGIYFVRMEHGGVASVAKFQFIR